MLGNWKKFKFSTKLLSIHNIIIPNIACVFDIMQKYLDCSYHGTTCSLKKSYDILKNQISKKITV